MSNIRTLPKVVRAGAAIAVLLFATLSTDAGGKDRQLWKHSDGYFVKLKGNRWQERGSKDEGKFNFIETRRTDAFVELYDKSRNVTIHLRSRNALYKDQKEKFTQMYSGSWVD